jgi:hypothetical protein
MAAGRMALPAATCLPGTPEMVVVYAIVPGALVLLSFVVASSELAAIAVR